MSPPTEHRSLDGVTAIGVDEVGWRRGHEYQTLVNKESCEVHAFGLFVRGCSVCPWR